MRTGLGGILHFCHYGGCMGEYYYKFSRSYVTGFRIVRSLGFIGFLEDLSPVIEKG